MQPDTINDLFAHPAPSAEALLLLCLALAYFIHYGCLALQHLLPDNIVHRRISAASTFVVIASGMFLGALYCVKAASALGLLQ